MSWKTEQNDRQTNGLDGYHTDRQWSFNDILKPMLDIFLSIQQLFYCIQYAMKTEYIFYHYLILYEALDSPLLSTTTPGSLRWSDRCRASLGMAMVT